MLRRKSEFFYAVSLVALLFAAAVPAVSQAPNDKAWTVLQAGLSNSNTDNRTIATRLLGDLPNNARAQDLALKAISDNRPEVRAAGAEALGNMQAKSAIPKLQQLARTDQDAGVVISAAKALVNLGDPLGYNVYYAILTGEMKSGASLMDEQKKMLKDPKKLAAFGFEQGRWIHSLRRTDSRRFSLTDEGRCITDTCRSCRRPCGRPRSEDHRRTEDRGHRQELDCARSCC